MTRRKMCVCGTLQNQGRNKRKYEPKIHENKKLERMTRKKMPACGTLQKYGRTRWYKLKCTCLEQDGSRNLQAQIAIEISK